MSNAKEKSLVTLETCQQRGLKLQWVKKQMQNEEIEQQVQSFK